MLVNLVEQFKRPKNLSVPQKGIVMYNDDPRRLGRIKCVVSGLKYTIKVS